MIPENEWKYLYNDSKPRASGDDPVVHESGDGLTQ